MSKHIALKALYKDKVRKDLAKELGIKNINATPKIEKVVVNMGTGEKLRNKEQKARLLSDFALITGQKPKIQAAKISVAGFSLRQGMPVGLTSTLRGPRMYAFLDKLISVVLPRLRDFRGVPRKSFDEAGNYTLGVKEHTVFPEIDLATIDRPHGLEITVVTSASNKKDAEILLEKLGMPFEKVEEQVKSK